jgi:hypothetical protein
MGRGGRLKAALDADKGVDYRLNRQKKLRRAAERRNGKSSATLGDDAVVEEVKGSSDEEMGGVSLGPV